MTFTTIIYLGSHCNQNCRYCDRDYIKSEIGNSILKMDQVDDLLRYVDTQLEGSNEPFLGFHGGEPFLYTRQMSKIIDHVLERHPTARFSILTNGTLLERNREFLERYGEYLNVSISYDFTRMPINRGYNVDIVEVLFLLEKYNCKITQLQWVIDPIDKKCFDIEVLGRITKLYNRFNIGMLTLIPLRHIRGKTKFRNIMDSVDIQDFMRGFLQFIQMLYVLKIKISIDGHSHGIDKDYFDGHKQVILSPDGYIYPEFDFLDYKVKEARIGDWRTGTLIRHSKHEKEITPASCHTCSQFKNCGIKYLYKLFDKTPSDKCEEFYRYLEAIVNHYGRLSKYQNLTQAVE